MEAMSKTVDWDVCINVNKQTKYAMFGFKNIKRKKKDLSILTLCYRYFYVRADKVMKLRHLLDKLGNISGMMNEEKDPEEFLNLLLNEIMRAEPFLYIR